jgi:hypothetical protein
MEENVLDADPDSTKDLVVTRCKHCIFAEWAGDEQNGCAFGRIEKFEDQGANIWFEKDPEKQYICFNRACNTRRTKEWGRKYTLDASWLKLVRSSVKVQCDIIILVNNESTDDGVLMTIASAYNQSPKPHSIIVLIEPGTTSVTPLHIVSFLRHENRGPWRVEEMPLHKLLQNIKSHLLCDV